VIVLRMNRGRYREIPEPAPGHVIYVHRSVKTRMEAEGLEGGKYAPGAKYEQFDHEYIP
jgi:hypothetical protein